MAVARVNRDQNSQPEAVGLPVDVAAEAANHHPVGAQDYPGRKRAEVDLIPPANEEDSHPLEES